MTASKCISSVAMHPLQNSSDCTASLTRLSCLS